MNEKQDTNEIIEEVETPKQDDTPKQDPPKQEQPSDDFQETILKLKEGYEVKMAKQKEEYEKKIEERNKVIKQLLIDDDASTPKITIVDNINALRRAQNKKW